MNILAHDVFAVNIIKFDVVLLKQLISDEYLDSD